MTRNVGKSPELTGCLASPIAPSTIRSEATKEIEVGGQPGQVLETWGLTSPTSTLARFPFKHGHYQPISMN